jgi:hypothetical protein
MVLPQSEKLINAQSANLPWCLVALFNTVVDQQIGKKEVSYVMITVKVIVI